MKYENDKMMNEIMRRGGKKSAERMRRKSRTVSILIGICAVWMVLLSIGSARIFFKPNNGWDPNEDPDRGGEQAILPGETTPNVGGMSPGVGGLPPQNPLMGDGQKIFVESPDKIEDAAHSVVKLEVYDSSDTKIANGSGFCIFEPNLLVTSAHVITNMDHMIAYKDDGDSFRIDHVIYGDTKADLAFCEIPMEAELQPLKMSDTISTRGERVVVIGSQFGITNLVTTGNTAGNWESDGVFRYIFTAPVSPGNSGGPLFNSKGEVLGVVTGTYEKGQNLNIALSVEEIFKAYDEKIRQD